MEQITLELTDEERRVLGHLLFKICDAADHALPRVVLPLEIRNGPDRGKRNLLGAVAKKVREQLL